MQGQPDADAHRGILVRYALTGLTRPKLPLLVAILAVLLTVPSLWGGWVADDHNHRLRLADPQQIPEQLAGLAGSPMKLFTFADGNPEHNRTLMDVGFWPWWTVPNLRAAFFRPVTVATHWLDYRLWPDRPALMHAHSLLWFAALVGAAAVFYRRFMGITCVAGLAAVLYAVDDARGMPVGFLANRNALLATLFGVLAIIAHDRWRRDSRRLGAIAAPLLLTVSLFSAEAGIGTIAYLFAHAVYLDPGTRRQRVVALLPYAVVVLVWRVVWSRLGCGVWGMAFYVDPLTEPLRYLTAVLERAPILLLGQLFLPPADLYLLFLDLGISSLAYVGTLVAVTVVCAIMLRRFQWDASARFFALGMVLSLLPICATFPSDRLLFFVGLGAFALMARYFEVVFGHPYETMQVGGGWTRRVSSVALGVALVVIHLGLAPVILAVRSAIPVGPPSFLEKLQVNVPMGAEVRRQTVVVVTAPLPILAAFLPGRRALDGLPVPAHTRVLAQSDPTSVTVSRPDTDTLVVRPAKGYLWLSADRLARGSHLPMSVGERVELTGMTAEVTEMTADGRPAEASFHFSVPLEDPCLRWLYWKKDRFAPFPLPGVGETVELISSGPGQ